MTDDHAALTRPFSFRPSRWHRAPAVRSAGELTRGERAADLLRNGMGSWAFVFTASVFLAVWMASNRNVGFDPYPFILLNLVLSCLAAMQGAILLIAARRSDQIASELAVADFKTNEETDALVHQILGELAALRTEVQALDATRDQR